MGMWKKITKLQKEVMRTPGPIRVQLLLLLTLTGSSVLSTGLQIYKLASNTSVENTSYRNESLEVADAGGRVRVTGKHTTALLRNLMVTGNAWGRIPLPEKSSPPTVHSEE